MRSSNDWRIDMKWLLILLIVDFMLVFQILPLGYMLYKAFTPQGTFSLQTFERLFSYNMNRSALVNTMVSGLSAMVMGTVIAFPLAWLVGRTNLIGKKFFRHLFVLTYMVPPYVGAMAWLRLLNPNVGSINVILRTLLGLKSAVGPLNIYSMGGMVWVLTTFFYPYAFITISRAMEKMDPSLEEASRISGASPFLTLLKVTLPIMTPSLIAGALLVFVSAASAYGIPSIVGAPGRVHTVTTRIIEYYGRGTQGLNDAIGLSVFLMTLALLILYISDFVLAKKQYITVSGKSTRPNIVDLRTWRIPLTIIVGLFAFLVVLLPFATILTTSLKIDVGKSLMAAGNFTLHQWTNIFSRSETMTSLKNSFIYASVSATVGILVAITMSYLMQRTTIRGRKLPDFLITLGSGSPSVVIALGLIMSMQGRFGVNIYNTAYILIVAYLVKYMMMGMRTVTSAISQIHVSLEESSQVSGASWITTMRKVTGPLIFPSIAAGWFLIFIPCFYELAMTTLLYSNSTKTIGFQLYEYWTFTSQPQASAMAFGILLIVIFINLILNRLTKGEFSI
ncbi:MAG: iron ABC transporter permease [Clostridiales bacterium]|nr:iron ABC transporter permease [Clostridiales bacterium]